jgi:aminobenzoyl-glutamate utilization protein A
MDVVELRRDLHQHPEVGFTEFRTASKVVETLQHLGYKVLYGSDAIDSQSRRGMPPTDELEHAYQKALSDGANPDILERMHGGNTAVVGILEGKKPGPTVAFRFDMDALPIGESSDADHLPYKHGFRSNYEGSMHACAHDGHTAIGMCFAENMANRNFSGTLMLLFQPAEEGGRGANAMVQKGIVDNVDEIYCLHLGLGVPLGEIYGGSTDWLATTKSEVHFHGVPAHSGLAPEKGRNALVGAATALLNIHALPRYSSGPTRVNVGILESGTAPNIIPHHAKLVVETRADSEEINKDLANRVNTIIKNSASMHELDEETHIIGEATTITCDDELVLKVIDQAQHIDGLNSFKKYYKAGAGEDASLLIRRVQESGGKGTYMIVGTAIAAPHHHQKFDIDEKALPMAVQLLENIAISKLT